MDKNVKQAISKILSRQRDIAFAYVFGSAARKAVPSPGSDIDLAVCFVDDPDTDRIYALICELESAVGADRLDLLVLNGCEDFILRYEVLKGERLYCRDEDRHAAFFSWTLRLYEDQVSRMRRFNDSTGCRV